MVKNGRAMYVLYALCYFSAFKAHQFKQVCLWNDEALFFTPAGPFVAAHDFAPIQRHYEPWNNGEREWNLNAQRRSTLSPIENIDASTDFFYVCFHHVHPNTST